MATARSIGGADATAYGRALERLAIDAFKGALPKGWICLRPGTPEDDARGIDLWVVTKKGPFAVQVKASAALAQAFRCRHMRDPIGIAVLHPQMPVEKIRARVCEAVEEARVLLALGRTSR